MALKMEIFSPFHLISEETQSESDNFQEDVREMNVSDETLEEYIDIFLANYRSTLEKFFSYLSPLIPFYAQHPFETFILRLGNNGVIIGHRPNTKSTVNIMRPQDFNPPLNTVDIFKVRDYWQTPFTNFDFRIRKYDATEAELEGKRQALSDALDAFWRTVEERVFTQICVQLLEAEKVYIQTEADFGKDIGFDVIGKVLLQEPAGFHRFEKWAFEFKHYKANRVSAKNLRQIESYLEASAEQIDIICLVTSGDLTSVGSHIAVKNPKIRIWDRKILQLLVNKHQDILEPYFAEYKVAIDKLSQQHDADVDEHIPSRYEEFKLRLKDCPSGREHSNLYEDIGIELWQYLFPSKLGKPNPQSRTIDGKQRRDVLFRNQRNGRFFQRVAEKFDSDFIIVDFKNYSEPVDSDVINDVTKYANKAIGTFIVIMCRFGMDDTVTATQVRILRDRNILVLIISDKQMLEMIVRKEKGENPEDVIEDIMDEILLQY